MTSILKQAFSFALTLFIPLLYLETLAIISYTPHTISLSFWVIIAGIFLAICGLVLWGISYLHLGLSFGVLPQKQKRVTKGVYKDLRHPMYIGIVCTFIGLSLALESKAGFIFCILVILPLLIVRTFLEEKHLLS